MDKVPEWVKEERRKARASKEYWLEGYKLEITESLLLYMERNNIKGTKLDEELSFDWQAFLRFDEFSLENLAEVSIKLGIDWDFIPYDVSEY